MSRLVWVAMFAALVACGSEERGRADARAGDADPGTIDSSTPEPDAGTIDAAVNDAMIADAMIADAMIADAMIADAMIADAMIADAMIEDATLPDAVVADAMPDDATPIDTGLADAGFDAGLDAGVDAGLPDSGADSGTPDGGSPADAAFARDAAVLVTNAEGGECTPGATDQGSCVDPSNVCVTWSPVGFTTQISTCIRPCTTDADCAASPIGGVCANVVVGLNAGRIEGIKACVSGTVGEGEVASLSLRHLPAPMVGCEDPYQAYPWYLGSLLFQLDDDQASCGLPCGSDADCAVGATPRTPFCSLNITNATVTPGICQVRRARKGAQCSQQTVIEMCDTSATPNMVCINLGLTQTHSLAPDEELGQCLEICDTFSPVCVNSADPVLTASCEFGFFTSPTLGVCDDNCSAFPDNCTGDGSPPPAGGALAGMTCVQFGGSFTTPDQGLCIDVAQTEPTFAPWDFVTPPAPPCEEDAHRCPDRTSCVPVDLGGGVQSTACAYGCDTTTATTGCSTTGFPTCTPSFGAGSTAGTCR